nr:MAG TPA: Protein of unknown function (DUF669) [Caudoviricetes sp.]
MSDFERELNWDDEISQESEFTLLEDGDYDFEVTKFERGRSNGSEKIPASNMAILTLRVSNGSASTSIIERLILHTKMEWKLSQFFCSIGQKKHGEPLRMNWNKVLGAKGRCKVYVDTYTTDRGEERKTNKISKFYDFQGSQPEQTAKLKWSAGDF